MCIIIKQFILAHKQPCNTFQLHTEKRCQNFVSLIENGIRIDRLSSDSSSGTFHFASAKLPFERSSFISSPFSSGSRAMLTGHIDLFG